MVGNGICCGAADFAEVVAAPGAGGFEDGLLLVVDVEQVELAGELRGSLLPGFEEASENGGAEGVEEEGEDGSWRELELDGVGFDDADEAAIAAGCAPEAGVGAGDGSEMGVEFDADYGFEVEGGSEENGAAHAGSEVDEGGLSEWVGGEGFLPALDEGVEDGGRDAVIGCGVAVVGMAGLEVTAGNEAAGLDSELGVEGVRRVAAFDGEAGKEAASSLPCGGQDMI